MNNENENESKFLADVSNKISELESYKKKLDKGIYELETKYLENTQSCGNIIKGWDQFFTTKSKIGGILKKTKFSFNERLFSQSSFSNSHLKEDGIGGVVTAYKSLGNISNGGIKSGIHHNGTHKKKILSSLSLKKKKLSGHLVNGRHNVNGEHQQTHS